MKKKDSSLRLCLDYRGLNNLTILNKYPLLLLNELLEYTQEATWFMKLDMKNGYNLIRIASRDEQKTAFKMKKGLFEYMVIPFELTNAPTSFQQMMDTIFDDLENAGVLWYVDDVLVYENNTEAKYQQIVEEVLRRYVEHDLAINLTKSEFHINKVIFLGYIINGSQNHIDLTKLEIISKQPQLMKKKEVQVFLGFANYYKRFIANYSHKARPLTELTKDVLFT